MHRILAKRNHNYNIPIPLIVLAYFLYWPVGVVLTVLRCISDPSKTAKTAEKNPNWRETPFDTAASRDYKASAENTASSGKTNAKNKAPASVKLLNVLGVFVAVVGALAAFSAAWTYFGGYWDLLRRLFVYSIPVVLASGGCFIGSKVIRDRETRLARIRAMIGNKKSLNLRRLASAAGKSLKQTRKDVQYMIDHGEFGDSAYIDLGTNNFMRYIDAEPDDPEGFDYRTVYGELLKQEKKTAEPENTEETNAGTDENASDKDNFSAIIRQIRRLNDEIEDKAISDKIDRMEEHTRNIFEYVTDHPDSMPQIRTFLNYYLPTTLKLLESYSRIERVGVAGENMKKSKENIERIMDLLVVGFEQQVDQLFRNESIDISSDISVLETMMAKDGLDGRKDFDLREFADSYSDLISDELTGGSTAAQSPDNQ